MFNRFLTPLFIIAALLLSACIPVKKSQPPEVVVSKPVVVAPKIFAPLPERWARQIANQTAIQPLLRTLNAKPLRTLIQKSVSRHKSAKKTMAHLNEAVTRTRKVRKQLNDLYDFRQAGGAGLETAWEQQLWKTFSANLKQRKTDLQLTDHDLLWLHRSFTSQMIKAWFYLESVNHLLEVSNEQQDTLSQIHQRWQTLVSLGKNNQLQVERTYAELLQLRQRLLLLQEAKSEASKALQILLGDNPEKHIAAIDGKVKSIPSKLPFSVLQQRPDIMHANQRVTEAFELPQKWQLQLPAMPITSGGGYPARQLSNALNKKNRAAIKAGEKYLPATLQASNKIQQKSVRHYAETLLTAMTGVRKQLNIGGRLKAQAKKELQKKQEAHKEIRTARGRYNAGRGDLTQILERQIPLLLADGRLSFLNYRLSGQRMDAYLALAHY